MGCSVCEQVPRLSSEAGELLLAPALGHTYGRLKAFLVAEHGARSVREYGGYVLGVAVASGGLITALSGLGGQLSTLEAQDCPAVFRTSEEPFEVGMLARTQSLATLIGRADSAWLAELIGEHRLTVHFQPIVHAAESTKVFAYESLLRGLDRDDALIPPAQLFGAARVAGMLFPLDRAARVAAINESSRHGLVSPLFINFNPTSIYDPQYCLRTTFAAAREVGADPSRFVFEVVESDQVENPEHLLGIMREYRSNGFRVALDDLGAGYGSLNLLQSLQPDFVKIDRHLVRDSHRDASREAILRNLVAMANDMGIEVIAEGIEEAAEAQLLQGLGVDYLQGFYFARPASPPPPSSVP